MSERSPAWDLELLNRLDGIAARLGRRLAEDFIELPSGLDLTGKNLTYGDIVSCTSASHTSRRIDNSPDLPPDYIPLEDCTTHCILMEGHLERIRRAIAANVRHSKRELTTELDGSPVSPLGGFNLRTEASKLLPDIAGHVWQQGYVVEIDPGARYALILDPIMEPFREGGALFPLMFTKGHPGALDLQRIATDYSALPEGRVD